MKKSLIILILLATSFSGSFSQLTVYNLSNCDVTFTVYLVDNNTCNITYVPQDILASSQYTFPTLGAGFAYIAGEINTFAFGGTWAYEIETRCTPYIYNCSWGYPDFVSGAANCQPILSAEWGACNQVRIF